MTNYPSLVFVLAFVVLWLSARVGGSAFRNRRRLEEDTREDFGVILAATLTLLGLIIGFSFSMAISRYDQRKNYEEAEANAIGTDYVRADLLPDVGCGKGPGVAEALSRPARPVLHDSRHAATHRRSMRDTAQLQAELWSAVRSPAAAQPTPVVALVVAGMNDVLNSQGYTQAAWWNRIPIAAWGLMAAIAICCNLLVGYGVRNVKAEAGLLLVLPLVVSISFFLIADIDSPRGGVIRVNPQNLQSLVESLRAQ